MAGDQSGGSGITVIGLEKELQEITGAIERFGSGARSISPLLQNR